MDQQTGEYVVTWEREVEDNQNAVESEREEDSVHEKSEGGEALVKKSTTKKGAA